MGCRKFIYLDLLNLILNQLNENTRDFVRWDCILRVPSKIDYVLTIIKQLHPGMVELVRRVMNENEKSGDPAHFLGKRFFFFVLFT